MAQNVNPIFGRIPVIAYVNGVTAANTAKDGTGTVDFLKTDGTSVTYTAPTDGAWLRNITVDPRGTNVASVMRIFLCRNTTNTTATNNMKIREASLPATTNTEVAALNATQVIPINMALPSGFSIFVTLGTAVAGGYVVAAEILEYTA